MSQIYFGTELYRFRADLLSIIRSLNIVYTATGICQASCVHRVLAGSGWMSNSSMPAKQNKHIIIKLCQR